MARKFAVEADMLGPIAAAVSEFAGLGAVAVFEVQSAAGVPDVVATVFDQEVIAARTDSGFVTDAASLSALLALSDALGQRLTLDVRQIAAAAGVTTSYIRSRVLPRLAARGLAVMTAPGRWTAVSLYRSPTSTLVTIEAKLRDWRRGLGQAARHAAGADAAWLVLDGACTRPAAVRADWFRAVGVGLAGLDQDGTLRLLLPPSGAVTLRARRELLAERLADLYCSGAVSGPVGRVFGRDLVPSTGADPRRRCAGSLDSMRALPAANLCADRTPAEARQALPAGLCDPHPGGRRNATNLRLTFGGIVVRQPRSCRSQKINMSGEMRPYNCPCGVSRRMAESHGQWRVDVGYGIFVTHPGTPWRAERAR